MPTFYETLGVGRTASAREVRRAYLDRARQLHPDTARDADERQMQAVNEAWFVLRDPARRARYDRELDGDGRSTPPPTEHDYEPEPEWVMEPEPAMEPGRASDPVMLLPAALVLGGIGLLVFSTMTMSGPLLALAFTVLLLGGAAFLVAPFVSLARHRRHR